ncbi:hypothetical protein [Streptomyces sp. NPDC093568]|uniref:hypothetical protein n=1 Tax=Streptomyces sp. NPDC093568 TaxID=3366041 RepID=UPI00381E3112
MGRGEHHLRADQLDLPHDMHRSPDEVDFVHGEPENLTLPQSAPLHPTSTIGAYWLGSPSRTATTRSRGHGLIFRRSNLGARTDPARQGFRVRMPSSIAAPNTAETFAKTVR